MNTSKRVSAFDFKEEARRTVQVNGRAVHVSRSNALDTLGGYLIIYGNQCRITMSAQLSNEAFIEGLEVLIDYIERNTKSHDVYLWDWTSHAQHSAH